ncbi:MAG TPA: SulP family inorganic anion transporter, partial [Gammaproteobacteria bacterium]|nr:SulP family inorganic anion transporter [Gammaproteobacteria bacterium]
MIALYEAHKAGLFSKRHWIPNIISGLIVGILALPLAMAFAIASGARPEQGLYTAIVAGILVSIFGGSRLQIAGPTGAFIVILAGITARYGISGLQIATMMAGCLLIIMGLTRVGKLFQHIPETVIVGFTMGIGVIIFVGQWKDFFGLQNLQPLEHFHEKILQLFKALPDFNPFTTALAALSLFLVIFSPRIFKKIPGPLVAMLVVTLLQFFFQFPGVATIG